MWMPNFLKKRILKFKSLVLDGKYKIEPAFALGGRQYYQFSSAMDMPASRGLSAMVIYDEFKMKADKEYLELHCRAIMEILNGDEKGKIDLNLIRQIHQNLRERINLAALPEHCYKLASVHFFDAEESIYEYDFKHNENKINEWKKNPKALSFFLTRPLRDYLPFSDMPNNTVLKYLNVAEKIANLHREDLQAVLSRKE